MPCYFIISVFRKSLKVHEILKNANRRWTCSQSCERPLSSAASWPFHILHSKPINDEWKAEIAWELWWWGSLIPSLRGTFRSHLQQWSVITTILPKRRNILLHVISLNDVDKDETLLNFLLLFFWPQLWR